MVSLFRSSLYVLYLPSTSRNTDDTQIGWLGAIIAAVAGSAYSLSQTHVAGPRKAPITYSPVWIAILWAGMFCLLGAMAMEHFERNLERFTPKDLPISGKHKPKKVPWWVWNFWLRRA
jgi:hypothetical protein